MIILSPLYAACSCATDLRSYTTTLGEAAAAWLAQRLQEESASAAASSGLPDTKTLRREVAVHQLLDDMGMPHLGPHAEGTAHAVMLMERYMAVQPMYEGLDDRERGPADELPVLAAGAWS